MSIIYCEAHDRRWDSDRLEVCPLCENCETVCPKCQSSDIGKRHAHPTFALPECDFWECVQCGHQWDHG